MPTPKPTAHRTIREAAYFIWENEGRPDGRAEEHWSRAAAHVATPVPQPNDDTDDEEKVLAGRPDANIPAMLTKDVPGGFTSSAHGVRSATARAGLAVRATCWARYDGSPKGRSNMRPEDVIADKRRPYTGAEYIAKPARRAGGLYRRRARGRRHHPSGVPQLRPLHGPPVRRAARPEAAGRADLPDRHRLRRLYAQIFPRSPLARGPGRRAGRHRRVGAPDLRLDGPHAGLQGRLYQHAGRPTPTITVLTPATRGPGTSGRRKPCRS